MKDLYVDEPVFKTQKIDCEKLDKIFYESYRKCIKNNMIIVAIDKNKGIVASLAINSIIRPDNPNKQKNNAGKLNVINNICSTKNNYN